MERRELLWTDGYSKRRRPSEYAVGYEALRWFVPKPRQHYPDRGLAVIDAPVANCFPVIRLLSRGHDNQLQRNAVRFLEHGMRADLNRASDVYVGRVGR